jgi:hypothetical protein
MHLVAHDGGVSVQNVPPVLALGAVEHAQGAPDDAQVQKVQRHNAQPAVAVEGSLEPIPGSQGGGTLYTKDWIREGLVQCAPQVLTRHNFRMVMCVMGLMAASYITSYLLVSCVLFLSSHTGYRLTALGPAPHDASA